MWRLHLYVQLYWSIDEIIDTCSEKKVKLLCIIILNSKALGLRNYFHVYRKPETYYADGFQREQGCAHEQGVFSWFADQRSRRYGRQIGEYVPEHNGESGERDDIGSLREGCQQLQVSDENDGHQWHQHHQHVVPLVQRWDVNVHYLWSRKINDYLLENYNCI